MGGQVIHHHDVGRERGCEELLDIGEEQLTVQRPVDHARCVDAIMAEAGDEGRRLPVSIWHTHRQPLPARRSPVATRHVGGSAGLVDEDQALRAQLRLPLAPGDPGGGDIGALLVGGKKLFGTGRVTEVACWAHFRRGIFDEHRGQATPLTTDLLERIGQLYAVEASVRGKPPDVRVQARQEHGRPVVDALRAVIDDALRKLSPRSDMAKALRYGVKLWPALTRFLDDGRLEIDNGVAERALRGVAVGRRNWLFAGSLAGGERAAALYSVIETAKANGVEPQAYIADVLAKLAGGWAAARWDELMPWNWRPPTVLLARAA